MKKYISILKHTKLFAGITDREIEEMLSCLNAQIKDFQKGEYIFHQGEYIHHIAVLVEGGLHIQQDDYWGNRSIINRIIVGEMFGEAYIAPESGALINDMVAIDKSTVVFFDARRILSTCPSACRFHSMVVQNLFFCNF